MILQEESIWALDGDGVGKLVLLHDLLVPFQVAAVLWLFKEDEAVGILLEFLNGGANLLIASFIGAQSQRSVGIAVYAKDSSTGLYKLHNLVQRFLRDAFYSGQDKHLVCLFPIAEASIFDAAVFQDDV